MNTLSYKTVSANKSTVKKEWLLVDASDEILGRLSSKVAKILRGKTKPSFTPHVDCGDNVIVINADKVRLTGNKAIDKEYIHHTGYPGGQRSVGFQKQMAKNPAFIVENAIKGMLPKNRLGKKILDNLYVYAGSEHPHAAQEPKQINLNSIK